MAIKKRLAHPARECNCQSVSAIQTMDRKGRRTQAARAQKARRIKQVILGTAFLVLLGAGWLYPLIPLSY